MLCYYFARIEKQRPLEVSYASVSGVQENISERLYTFPKIIHQDYKNYFSETSINISIIILGFTKKR